MMVERRIIFFYKRVLYKPEILVFALNLVGVANWVCVSVNDFDNKPPIHLSIHFLIHLGGVKSTDAVWGKWDTCNQGG